MTITLYTNKKDLLSHRNVASSESVKYYTLVLELLYCHRIRMGKTSERLSQSSESQPEIINGHTSLDFFGCNQK